MSLIRLLLVLISCLICFVGLILFRGGSLRRRRSSLRWLSSDQKRGSKTFFVAWKETRGRWGRFIDQRTSISKQGLQTTDSKQGLVNC
ncbi:unnamed protein product [Brassica rapa subsp. narinosa]